MQNGRQLEGVLSADALICRRLAPPCESERTRDILNFQKCPPKLADDPEIIDFARHVAISTVPLLPKFD